MAQTDGYNSDIASEQVQKLAELFPEVVREGKVDFDALKATLGEDVEYGEKYGLGWKGKSGVFAKIQQKSVSTLHPQPDESVDWDTTQNMFIEGDNLEALKVLHKAYYGKIKMIYIDPPYNTGNDFVYNDDFAKTRRQHAMDEGAIDEEGNATRDDGLRANTGGHKHSNWLDMMYPRLFLARNLLRQDGVIFVSIDDNEVHNLRLMMNEIFGEENFVAQFIWRRRSSSGMADFKLSADHEYVICYKRSGNFKEFIGTSKTFKSYSNPDNDLRGPWTLGDLTVGMTSDQRPNQFYSITDPATGNVYKPNPNRVWAYIPESMQKLLNEKRVYFPQDSDRRPMMKRFKRDLEGDTDSISTLIPSSGEFSTGLNSEGTRTVQELFDGKFMDYPKPVSLIKSLAKQIVRNDEIALDFFSGSGTLAHSIGELNADDHGVRRWICVQLPELINENSEAFIAGYKTISDISRERIRRAGAKISKDFADKIAERGTPLDLGFRSYVLGDSNFKKWNEQMREADEIRQATLDQLNPIEDSASDDDLLAEILLKRGISPLIAMETHDDFIFIPSETLAISLSRHMTEELFTTILAKSPSQIILLDQAFRDDVNLKTNLVLQAEKRDVNVEVL